MTAAPWLGLTLVLLCLCGATNRLNAQTSTTTSIIGTVTDSSGALIVGASVQLKNQNTGALRETTSTTSGEYAFLELRPGTYSVTVTYKGFQTAQVTDRTVDIGAPAHVDVVLTVGTASQTVTVSAKGADLINTTSAEVSGTITTKLVENLPLASQNFLNLAAVTPGSSPEDSLGIWSTNGSLQVSSQQTVIGWNPVGSTSEVGGVIAGGQRGEAGSVSIDGSNVQSSDYQAVVQIQSPASIQEVKVESGIMNAEFGYGSYAVNVTTKGGTNRLHGQAFEYLRNKSLDANFLTNIESHVKLPAYRQNEFGGAVGGPVLKDKLHFFANYAGKRAWQGTSTQSLVPTAAMRNGDMNDVGNYTSGGVPIPGNQVYNPFQVDPGTGQRMPFAGNVIPTGATNLCAPNPTCIDPAALAMLQYTPLPTGIINNLATYVSTNVTSIQQDQGTGRIDWDKSTSSRIYIRYTDFRNYNIATGALPLQGNTNPFSSKNVAASWTKTLGPTAVNQLWISYTRPKVAVARDQSAGDVAKQIGLSNTSALGGSPNLQVPGYQLAFSNQSVSGFVENTYQLKDDFAMIRSKHNMKFGFQTVERHYDNVGQTGDKGTFIWSNLYSPECPTTATGCLASIGGTNTPGFAYADYLMGTVWVERLNLSGSDTHQNTSYYGVFAQDTWRATSKLTINYGLRYEYWKPWVVVRNNSAGFDKYTGELSYALQNPLDFFSASTHYGRDAKLNPNFPRSLVSPGSKNFAPRAGLAYMLTPNTEIRAGAGIFFDGNSTLASAASGIGPFGYSLNNSGTGGEPTPPYLFKNAFPAPPATGAVGPNPVNPPSFGAVDLTEPYKSGTVNEWTFGIQRRLGNSWGLELTYFGYHATHLPQAISLNPSNLPSSPGDTSSAQQRRIYPGWGQITGSVNEGLAKYNALTTTLKSNYWHGLTTLATFTWSKDKVTAAYGIANQGMMDFRHLYDWAGPSLINPDYRSAISWTYELPMGRGKWLNTPGVTDVVAGGWRVSGVAQFSQGGHQWFLGQDNTGTALATGYGMDNLTCNPNIQSHAQARLRYINVGCYQVPAYGTFGNATLGSFIEPGYNNWDLAATKSFNIPVPRLSESRMDFRADFFNAFNHTQWSYVCNQYNCRVPGRANGTHNPRQIQLSLNYWF